MKIPVNQSVLSPAKFGTCYYAAKLVSLFKYKILIRCIICDVILIYGVILIYDVILIYGMILIYDVILMRHDLNM
jgi:hypothetical protein